MAEIKTMQEQIQETIKQLEEEGFDFDEEVALIHWTYPEIPDFQFQLAIVKGQIVDDEEEGMPAVDGIKYLH